MEGGCWAPPEVAEEVFVGAVGRRRGRFSSACRTKLDLGSVRERKETYRMQLV